MAKTLPPMLQVMKDIGGVELPESLIKLAQEAEVDGKAAPDSGQNEAAASSTSDEA
jgi:flotillin